MAIQAQLHPDYLGVSHNWMESNYGFNELFCFNLQQKQQEQQLQNLQQKTQNPCFDSNGLLSNNNNHHESKAFSESIAVTEIEKQGQQIDRFISLQNERLRLLLQEQRRQQMTLLLRKYEERTVVSLKQKQEEIAKSMNRTMELEDLLRKTEFQRQTWYRLAKENEAIVANLNTTIEQLKQTGCYTNEVDDTESCYRGEEGTGENRGQGLEERENQEQRRDKRMVCKTCNFRNSCVVFLPCRHLCSCKDCQASLNSCPVCGMAKKASIEALI